MTPDVLRTPRAPGWMAPEAREFWRRVARELVEAGVLHPLLDAPLLEMCATHYAMWRRAVAAWQDATDPELREVLRQVAGQQVGLWLRVAGELGLSRAGREHLRRMMELGEDPTEELVERLRGGRG